MLVRQKPQRVVCADAAYPVDDTLDGRVNTQRRERYAQDDLFDTMEVPVSQMLFPLYIAIEPDNGRLTEMAEQKKKNVDKRLPK